MEINKHEGEELPTMSKNEKHLPNYMKPTSSSDARKDQAQAQAQVHADHKNSNSASKTSYSVAESSATKSPMSFKTKCSVRAKDSNMDVVNRHTCSTTIKDSKFPEALELSVGATEAEGTSLMRVCRYKHCSLNSHKHDVKSFVKSKRKQLKAQKSMKAKGLSPFRKPVSSKDRKEIDSGQYRARARSELEIVSLIEEVGNDLFVKVSCKAEAVEPVHETFETYEDDECESDIESSMDLSIEELEGEIDSIDCECYDHECNVDEEKHTSFKPEDDTMGHVQVYEYYDLMKDSEGLANEVTYAKAVTFEAFASDLEDTDNTSHSSTDFSDDTSTHRNSFESDDMSVKGDIKRDVYVASVPVECDLQSLPEKENNAYEANRVRDETAEDNKNQSCSDLRSEAKGKANLFASQISARLENVDRDNIEGANDETVTPVQNIRFVNLNSENDDITNQSESQSLYLEELLEEIDREMDCLQLQQDSKHKGARTRSFEDSSDECINLKLKMRIRRRVAEKMDEMREFNPRGPNFLPEQPDPESEKVDLRHQTVDERKNAEEWMIDYALQRAVTKLASARRRKVALLVEAFEAVSPVPLSY